MSEESRNQTIVYVGTYTDERTEGLHILGLDTSTGALEFLSKVDVHNPFFLTTDSREHTLYAACVTEEFRGKPGGKVVSFAIRPGSGDLELVDERHAEGRVPCYLSIDPDDRCLLVGNYGSGSVVAFAIEGAGRFADAAQVVQHEGTSVNPDRQEGPHVHSIVLSPDHRYAFAADLGIDKVMIYRFDASAATLEPNDPPSVSTRPGAGPRHLIFHPNARTAYLINELDSTFVVYDYDASSGGLSERQILSALPESYEGDNHCADIQIHASGRFLYGSNRGHDSFAIVSIDDSTGDLTPAGHEPSGGAWPWNLEIDPSGSFLLAANQRGHTVTTFYIDAENGALEPTGASVEVRGAVCVTAMALTN